MNFDVKGTISALTKRVIGMIFKAKIESVDDSKAVQTIRTSTGFMSHQETERHEPWGIVTHPIKGARTVCLACGSNPDHIISLLVYDGHRPVNKINQGETALYNKDGILLHLKDQGHVLIGHEGDTHTPIALAQEVQQNLDEIRSDIQQLVSAINGAVIVGGDGGASFKTTLMSGLTGIPKSYQNIGSDKVKST